MQEGEALAEGEELSRSFGQSIVVAVDAPCSPSEIHGGGGGGGGEEAAPAPAAAAPAAAALKSRPPGVVLRGSGGSGKRPTFKTPRPKPQDATLAAAEPAAQPYAAAAALAAPAPQRRPFQAPARQLAAPELSEAGMPQWAMRRQGLLLGGPSFGAPANQARSGESGSWCSMALHACFSALAHLGCNQANCDWLHPLCFQVATSWPS